MSNTTKRRLLQNVELRKMSNTTKCGQLQNVSLCWIRLGLLFDEFMIDDYIIDVLIIDVVYPLRSSG